LAEAHEVLGLIREFDYEWSAAEHEFLRAIELKPEYPTAHHRYALLLSFTGRADEGRAEIERARQLDPTSLIINAAVAGTLVNARAYDPAIEQAKKTLELDPSFWLARGVLALAYLGQSRYAEAVAEIEKLGPPSALASSYTGFVGYAYAVSGHRTEAQRVLADLKERAKSEYVSPSARALIYIGLGDKDQAFAWLDKGYAERDWRLRELKVSPLFDSLRSDPRFTRLLRQVHLE